MSKIFHPFVYTSSDKNNGKPNAYSPDNRAVMRAFNAYYEQGGTTDWISYSVTKLPCDTKEEHWPDACWHYRIAITENR